MQYYRSKSLAGLHYKAKYKLKTYTNLTEPLVIFGMYREEDYETLINHESEVVIVWQGSDAKDLPSEWIEAVKTAKNYSCSHWVQQSLLNHGIESELRYLSATKPKKINYPNGDSIYFYSSIKGSDVYGEEIVDEIEKIIDIPIIRVYYGMYKKSEINEIYKKCFVNLRLTNHDGCPNTNLEMGLMGRKSIYNGSLPHSIKWTDVDSICESIMKEYKNRNNDNKQVSKDFIKFINDNKL